MHSHPSKYSTTVAINALWCVLIALVLLAFPIVARQARLQTMFSRAASQPAPAVSEPAVKTPSPAVLLAGQPSTPDRRP